MENSEIKQQIERIEENIKRVRENITVEENKVKIQLKHPRPINPQYEFELRDEYLEHFRNSIILDWKRKRKDMLFAIKDAEKEIEELNNQNNQKEEKISYAG